MFGQKKQQAEKIIKSSILFLKVCLGEKKQKNWLESMSKLMGHKTYNGV